MDFKLPEMSKGTIIPNGIIEQQLKEAKEKELRKQQWRHDPGVVRTLPGRFLFNLNHVPGCLTIGAPKNFLVSNRCHRTYFL